MPSRRVAPLEGDVVDSQGSVLRLLEQFMNNDGKFAIKGFPDKLGLMLHGPPGNNLVLASCRCHSCCQAGTYPIQHMVK
jgi:hypothetical protein